MNKVVFIKNGLVKYEDYKETLDQLEDKVRECKLKDKEIEKLNNIIDELEKWLNEEDEKMYQKNLSKDYVITFYSMVLYKLKELKEGK